MCVCVGGGGVRLCVCVLCARERFHCDLAVCFIMGYVLQSRERVYKMVHSDDVVVVVVAVVVVVVGVVVVVVVVVLVSVAR